MNKKLIMLLPLSLLILNSCGSSKSNYRAYEKQAAPADIKISKLDLATNEIQLRFEYRSYVHNKLDTINCDIEFSSESRLNIQQNMAINLDAFSIEILTFSNINITRPNSLLKLKQINYSLECHLKYDNGHEVVFEHSALYLVPGSELKYR
ncbi:MAG: hypothetical protein JKY19_10700 [Alcanivoracaceae bacterium]|nr:hypothetical protein [Alcanivoracaceae bacterium]